MNRLTKALKKCGQALKYGWSEYLRMYAASRF